MAKTHILHIQAVHANLIFKSGSHFKIMDLHFWFLHGQNYMYSESEEVLSRVLLKRWANATRDRTSHSVPTCLLRVLSRSSNSLRKGPKKGISKSKNSTTPGQEMAQWEQSD